MSKPLYFNIISTALLTVIITFAGIVFPFSSFMWGVPIAVMTAREGVRPGVLAALLSFLMLALLVTPQWAGISLFQFGSLGIVLGYFLKQEGSWQQVFFKTAAVYLLISLLVFVLPYSMGTNTGNISAELSSNINNLIALWEKEGLIEALPQQVGSVEEIKLAMETAVNWVIRLLPSLLMISALGATFFNFLIARWTLNKRDYPVPDFPPFRGWWVPWYTSWGAVIGLGLALLGDYLSNNSIFTVGLNLIVLHLPLALFIGLSVSAFLFTKIRSLLFQAFIIFTAFFYLPITVGLILLAGVFDPLFDFRKIHSRVFKE